MIPGTARVSFSVRGGELFALPGTNGAGKTSTLEVPTEVIAAPGVTHLRFRWGR
jgi:ABC-type multidrug transport system ATPase subunit